MSKADSEIQMPKKAMKRGGLLAAALIGLVVFNGQIAGCHSYCDQLQNRWCKCDPKSPLNKQYCREAKDEQLRRQAVKKASRSGKDLEEICQARLKNFSCPARIYSPIFQTLHLDEDKGEQKK